MPDILGIQKSVVAAETAADQLVDKVQADVQADLKMAVDALTREVEGLKTVIVTESVRWNNTATDLKNLIGRVVMVLESIKIGR